MDNTIGVIHDCVLGEIPYTEDDLRLYQTPEMTRLRDVSVSVTPPSFIGVSGAQSKFVHSVAVSELARLLGTVPEFAPMARDLYFAALIHDVATPPFSHLSERFLVRMCGVDHEEFLSEVLDGSELAKEIERQGGDVATVIRLAQGKLKPWSEAINGPIDVDNLHNSLGYGLSLGLLARQVAYYDPRALVRGFGVYNNTFCLDWELSRELDAWVEVRRKVYRFVYSPEHLAVGTMLFRALEFARRDDELPRHFFRFTDSEAIRYLASTERNARTRRLILRAYRWHRYRLVAQYETSQYSPKLATYLKQESTRNDLADLVSRELRLAVEDVTVHASIAKGIRRINIPLLSDAGALKPYTAMPEGSPAIIQVYVAPDVAASKYPGVSSVINQVLQQYS